MKKLKPKQVDEMILELTGKYQVGAMDIIRYVWARGGEEKEIWKSFGRLIKQKKLKHVRNRYVRLVPAPKPAHKPKPKPAPKPAPVVDK